MFALQTILVIIVVSGTIAFVGDRVGHYIGRKRLTLFNFRPRHTAMAITILTGSLIAIFTGTILFTLSADVRTAVFGLDKLKSMISERSSELEKIKTEKETLTAEINDLKKTLKDSKKEISDLQKTKETMSKEIKTARSGQLLFRVNDIVTSTVIDVDNNKTEIKEKLSMILSNTDSAIRKIMGDKKKHYIVMAVEELDEAVDFVANHPGSMIVRVISARNVVLGEDIPVHFELFENFLVFKKGETILTGSVNGTAPTAEIEQKIKDILAKTNERSIEKGMLPGPDGSVGTIPYSRIFEVARAIKSKNKNVTLNIISLKDIFSVGPLEIDLKITN